MRAEFEARTFPFDDVALAEKAFACAANPAEDKDETLVPRAKA